MLEATIGSKTKTVEFEVKNKQHQLTHLVNFNEKNSIVSCITTTEL